MPLSLKLFLAGFIALAVGGLWSASEIRMRRSGRTVIATLMPESEESAGRKRGDVPFVFIDEDGSERNSSFTPAANWQRPEDNQIEVVYLPGRPDTVRFVGEKSYVCFIILGCSIVLLGAGVWFFKHESLVPKGDRLVKKEEPESDMLGKLVVPQSRPKSKS